MEPNFDYKSRGRYTIIWLINKNNGWKENGFKLVIRHKLRAGISLLIYLYLQLGGNSLLGHSPNGPSGVARCSLPVQKDTQCRHGFICGEHIFHHYRLS